MGEAGEALGRAVEFFFVKLGITWWNSLGKTTRNYIEVISLIFLSTSLLTWMLFRFREFKMSISSTVSETGKSLKQDIASWIKVIKETRPTITRGIKPTLIAAFSFSILAAFGSWPYNFYILTRLVVCLTFAWLAILFHHQRTYAWAVLPVILALIFNPIVRFHFERDTWQIFNVITALILVPIFFLHTRRLESEKAQEPSNRKETAVVIIEPNLTSDLIKKKYKYCETCSVRVGSSDGFYRRCGTALD